MTLRDLDIEVDVEIDASPIIRANHLADDLLDKMRQLGRQHRIDLEINNAEAGAQIRALEAQMRQLTASPHRIDVEVDSIADDVTRMQAQLQPISRHTVDIDVDSAGAAIQIAAIQAQLATLRGTSNITVSGGAGSSVPNVGGGMMGGLNPMMTAGKAAVLAVVLPAVTSAAQVGIGAVGTLGVSVGILGGGLLSLGSAAGVAAIGLGGVAALGVSAISELYDENAKLTAAQQELKKHTDGVIKSWEGLNKTLQPFTFGAIESGAVSINTLLDRSEPILQRATIAVDGLFDSLDRSLQGNNMTSFFDYAERSIGPITTNIGNGIGLIGQSVANTMVALEPLTSWSAQGFENSMGRFADWTAGLKDSDKLKEFMQYTQDNLPKIGSIMKDATGGVTSFFAAFDVTASDGLDWMAGKMKDFATWASQLDENQGFQNMLARIKADGPEVAKIAGNIAGAVVDITTALSNFGRRDDGVSAPLKYFEGLTSGQFLPAELKIIGKIIDFGKDDVPEAKVDVSADTTVYHQQMSNLAATAPTINVHTMPLIDPMSFRAGITAPFVVPATAHVDEIKVDQVGPTIKAAAQISSVDTSMIGPVKMPMQQDNSIVDRLSAVLNSFVWPQLPKFEWPRFDWPPMPRFSWPPIPTVRVSVNVTGGAVSQSQQSIFPRFPGFSTGLGRVEAEAMPAIVHKDEAILQDHNADILRDMGVLQGDGRNPIVDTSHLAPHNTTSNTSSQSVQIEVGGVQVIVQGGKTNAETGQSVQDAMEEFFARMNFTMFQAREW